MNRIGIALAGIGTVGGAVWNRLQSNGALICERTGVEIVVKKVLARNAARIKELGIPKELVTTDWAAAINDPEVHAVVEVMGGTKDAYTLIRTALEKGKHVVTANKALLAERGEELFRLADKQHKQLLFEGSVAGGIPLIKALHEGLVANRVLSLHGIINGTCNYILSQMSKAGLSFEEALAAAQKKGYAEAEPSLDIDGHDTAHKAMILTALAYGFWPKAEQIYTEGITQVDPADIIYARRLGYEIKLLAIIKSDSDNTVEVRVQPTLIPHTHVLASVSGAYNAIQVKGDVVGDALFYGMGAGSDATASAVLGDIADLTPDGFQQRKSPVGCLTTYPRIKGIDEIISRYYLRLEVIDIPGVLAQIAGILGSKKIGISSVFQPEGRTGKPVRLILMVHDAQEKELKIALDEIAGLEVVKSRPVRLRVEDLE